MGTVAKLPALDTPDGRLLLKERWTLYAYAAGLLGALYAGRGDRVRTIHADLNAEGEETYRAVWSFLNSRERSAIKRILEMT